MRKHGHANPRSSTYRSWEAMKYRCTSHNAIQFDDYGGRGISFPESWRKFENFLADMGERPIGCFLERKDNSIGYSKENCKWASQKEQNNNKRNVKKYKCFDGEFSLAELAEMFNVTRRFLYQRINRDGMTVEDAVSRKNRVCSNRRQDNAARLV